MGPRLHQGLRYCMVCYICWNGGSIADGSGNSETLWNSEGAHRRPQRQRSPERCSLQAHVRSRLFIWKMAAEKCATPELNDVDLHAPGLDLH